MIAQFVLGAGLAVVVAIGSVVNPEDGPGKTRFDKASG